jgi:hypothetical protein
VRREEVTRMTALIVLGIFLAFGGPNGGKAGW